MMTAATLTALPLLKATQEADQLHYLSIVPAGNVVPFNDITGFDLANANRRLVSALKISGVRWAIGGWDISLNIDNTSPRYWSVHAYVVTAASSQEFRDIKNGLREMFHKSRIVRRPVFGRSFEPSPARLSYAWKYHFYKKYLDEGVIKYPEWRSPEITNLDYACVLPMLHHAGLSARTILLGLRATETYGSLQLKRVVSRSPSFGAD